MVHIEQYPLNNGFVKLFYNYPVVSKYAKMTQSHRTQIIANVYRKIKHHPALTREEVYENNKLSRVRTFYNGWQMSIKKFHHCNNTAYNNVAYNTYYYNGERFGPSTFYTNGKLEYRTFHINGYRHGQQMHNYGKIINNYHHGLQHGEQKRNGKHQWYHKGKEGIPSMF